MDNDSMNKQNSCCLVGARPSEVEACGIPQAQCTDRHSSTIPRFRGVLLCRRCDSCGTRISFKGEAQDKLVLKCPECEKEYIFFERPA
ncbi:MAG: hypothetical protein AB9866_15255 [Syntrophobacteraceae bacterium]